MGSNNFKNNIKYIKNQLNKTEKNWKHNNLNRYNRLSQMFCIPEDSFNKNMFINLVGNNNLQVDNYGKISISTEHEIELCNCYQKLIIKGDGLKIICYTPSEISIVGIIKSLQIY